MKKVVIVALLSLGIVRCTQASDPVKAPLREVPSCVYVGMKSADEPWSAEAQKMIKQIDASSSSLPALSGTIWWLDAYVSFGGYIPDAVFKRVKDIVAEGCAESYRNTVPCMLLLLKIGVLDSRRRSESFDVANALISRCAVPCDLGTELFIPVLSVRGLRINATIEEYNENIKPCIERYLLAFANKLKNYSRSGNVAGIIALLEARARLLPEKPTVYEIKDCARLLEEYGSMLEDYPCLALDILTEKALNTVLTGELRAQLIPLTDFPCYVLSERFASILQAAVAAGDDAGEWVLVEKV